MVPRKMFVLRNQPKVCISQSSVYASLFISPEQNEQTQLLKPRYFYLMLSFVTYKFCDLGQITWPLKTCLLIYKLGIVIR